jgi:hypothetical protein
LSGIQTLYLYAFAFMLLPENGGKNGQQMRYRGYCPQDCRHRIQDSALLAGFESTGLQRLPKNYMLAEITFHERKLFELYQQVTWVI